MIKDKITFDNNSDLDSLSIKVTVKQGSEQEIQEIKDIFEKWAEEAITNDNMHYIDDEVNENEVEKGVELEFYVDMGSASKETFLKLCALLENAKSVESIYCTSDNMNPKKMTFDEFFNQ